MTDKNVLKIFKSENALLSGHFLLSSGLHSPNYMQCALVLQKPWVAEKLCNALAQKIKKSKIKATVVIGPAMGGITAAYELGRAMKLKAIFAERSDNGFTLRRGFSLTSKDRVLVVEDVVTTGKSSAEVIQMVKAMGAKTVAVCSIVDRSEGKRLFDVPLVSLLPIHINTYEATKCPLCQDNRIALVKPGSRAIK